MWNANITTTRPVDYFILTEPRADGPIIGYYAGHPIPAAVVDQFGRRHAYAGIAPRLRSGSYDIGSLRPGEWIIEPGLVFGSGLAASDGLPEVQSDAFGASPAAL